MPPLILVLRRQCQENTCEYEATMVYRERIPEQLGLYIEALLQKIQNALYIHKLTYT